LGKIDRRPDSSEILADFNQKRRHMSERVFYPDTNDVSSTSKVVALSIAVFRFNALTLQRFNASTKPYDFFRFNRSTTRSRMEPRGRERDRWANREIETSGSE
jgi:hypothetical protein